MRKGAKLRKILLSFVGTNDRGKLDGPNDGAILTVFKKRKFDEVHLLWNPTKNPSVSFEEIAKYVKNEIVSRGYCNSVKLRRFDCKDVTDHNEIYPKLLASCLSLSLSPQKKFTAAIASGTPAMQVCWILMAESGDFPLELIRSNEPRYGKPLVTPVKLGTSLPRILHLEKEKEELAKEKDQLIPNVEIDIPKGTVSIGKARIPFSPMEFSYYRYFAELAKQGMEPQRFGGISVPRDFLKKIVEFHKQSFEDAELFRDKSELILKKSDSHLDIRTFRANVTKANTRIKKAIGNIALAKVFEIIREGKRHATLYGMRTPKEKIIFIDQ